VNWQAIEKSGSVHVVTYPNAIAVCVKEVGQCAVAHYSSGGMILEVFVRPYDVFARNASKPVEIVRSLECYDRLRNPLLGPTAETLYGVCKELIPTNANLVRLDTLPISPGDVRRVPLWNKGNGDVVNKLSRNAALCDEYLGLQGKEVRLPNVSRMFPRIPAVVFQGGRPVWARYLDLDAESGRWSWNPQKMFPDMPRKWTRRFEEMGWSSFSCK
jgi:hypothetical protein